MAERGGPVAGGHGLGYDVSSDNENPEGSMANEVSTGGHPDMDYAEHEKTYEMFIALFKWGTVFCVGCVVLLGVLTL